MNEKPHKHRRRLVVILIKPTKYDDIGYPLRFWKGVLPSNTLAAMYGLTKQLLADGTLPYDECTIELRDDSCWAQRVDQPAELVMWHKDPSTTVVVGLVGVQTNQFPRARDIAYACKTAGADVVIGGFHVSGSISALHDGIEDAQRQDVPCPGIMPPEIVELMERGIIVCHGEAEEVWPKILADIAAGEPLALYRGGRPDLTMAALPEYPEGFAKNMATRIGTFDTGRGCPFVCTFCTIINVQGRTPRYRDPQLIVDRVDEMCAHFGQAVFFFTDDNFARNPHWETLLDGLIALRQRGRQISFMIEADLASYKIKGFAEKLAAAGCTQVFMGMETVNEESLRTARKSQNKPEHYAALCQMLMKLGIAVHVGYIIGFPNDTRASILRDVKTIQTLGVSQASFFIMTPLPGSEDHIRAFVAGAPMSPEFNSYDSFHAVMPHPRMTGPEIEQTMRDCFATFYTPAHMIRILKQLPEAARWGMLRNYFWYWNSALSEGVHPMMCGFWSMRQFGERRADYPAESHLQFCRRQLWFRLRYFGCVLKQLYIFQYVYFEVELRDDLAARLSGPVTGLQDWWARTFALQPTRRWLNNFWIRYGSQKWRLLWQLHWHVKMVPHALTEAWYTFRFFRQLVRNFGAMTR